MGKEVFESVLPDLAMGISHQNPLDPELLHELATVAAGIVSGALEGSHSDRVDLSHPGGHRGTDRGRFAHIVEPYAAFSTLTPWNSRPSSATTTAPTWNSEYGA